MTRPNKLLIWQIISLITRLQHTVWILALTLRSLPFRGLAWCMLRFLSLKSFALRDVNENMNIILHQTTVKTAVLCLHLIKYNSPLTGLLRKRRAYSSLAYKKSTRSMQDQRLLTQLATQHETGRPLHKGLIFFVEALLVRECFVFKHLWQLHRDWTILSQNTYACLSVCPEQKKRHSWVRHHASTNLFPLCLHVFPNDSHFCD